MFAVIRGAGDTVRSIIISANSRLALLENPQILRILSKDDLHLEELGIGVNVGDNSVTADQIMALQKSRKEVRSFFDKNFTKGVFREKVLRIISTLNL